MRVAVVTVGDEILAGDTVNTNATWLCEQLTDRGVTVDRITTVPDVVDDIARVVNEYHAEHDAVIVTGGLGPTHDDVTMEGIAAAVGRPVEPHTAAQEWLTTEKGYAADDLADGTTALPRCARMLPNEVGVAPGAVVEGIYAFPGVPAEMQAMFDSVATEFSGEQTVTETVAIDEYESELIDRIADLREQFAVTVGSYPGECVRVKLTSTDPEAVAAARRWLTARVSVADTDDETA
jgi:molybdenum cofactor synthesis domain-containing protein